MFITFFYVFLYFIVNILGSYEDGMAKLVQAEDTSHIDDTGISSNEMREREKQRRRIKAKKHIQSSSEESDLEFYNDKENSIKYDKILPTLPQKEHFISSCKQLLGTSMQNTKHVVRENSMLNAVSNNGKY